MKIRTLTTALLIAIGLTACGSEPAKPSEAPKSEALKSEAPKQESTPVAETAKAAPIATTSAKEEGPGQGEMKKVCHDKIGKDGKSIQECKEIKVRKKLEGTEIPPAKDKK